MMVIGRKGQEVRWVWLDGILTAHYVPLTLSQLGPLQGKRVVFAGDSIVRQTYHELFAC